MKLSHVLVALDMTDHDRILLQAARYLAERLDTSRTYFAHVLPQLDFSPEVTRAIEKLNNGKNSITQQIQNRIQTEVEVAFLTATVDTGTILVNAGKPYDQISEWASTYDADLIIVGHKVQSEVYSMIATRLARNLKASVWFVPKTEKVAVNNILVPIDFSENAMRALQTAIQWKRRDDRVKITPCHVYSKSLSYYMYGEYYSWALDEDIHKYYQQYQGFLDRFAIDDSELQDLILVENERFNTAYSIRQRARLGKFDLIMVGATGHSSLHSLVIGSVTEELLEKEKEIAVLLVR
ncbi:MAG: universal stress protein [Saprospiraceae bacterium]